MVGTHSGTDAAGASGVSAGARHYYRRVSALRRLAAVSEAAPSARARELVRGGFDMHVHIAPDVVERKIDDVALARRCRRARARRFRAEVALLLDRGARARSSQRPCPA